MLVALCARPGVDDDAGVNFQFTERDMPLPAGVGGQIEASWTQVGLCGTRAVLLGDRPTLD